MTEDSCVEIHGGNLRIDRGLVRSGLDIWLWCEPSGGGEEGGDVLFVSTCNHDRLTKVYLADVAGHGESVAPVAHVLGALVRNHLHDMDHAGFLRALNESAEEISREGLFATMAAVSFDRAHDRVVYGYAAHPRMLLRESGAASFISLEPDYCPLPGTLLDLAIGVIPETSYRQSAVPFRTGDLLVLYSDGLTEVRIDEAGRRLDVEGLLSLADGCSTADARSFRDDLLRAFAEVHGVTRFDDDASFAVVRAQG